MWIKHTPNAHTSMVMFQTISWNKRSSKVSIWISKGKKRIELNISFGGFNHQVLKNNKHKSPNFCRFLIGNRQYKKMFKFVAFMWPLWMIVILATTQNWKCKSKTKIRKIFPFDSCFKLFNHHRLMKPLIISYSQFDIDRK